MRREHFSHLTYVIMNDVHTLTFNEAYVSSFPTFCSCFHTSIEQTWSQLWCSLTAPEGAAVLDKTLQLLTSQSNTLLHGCTKKIIKNEVFSPSCLRKANTESIYLQYLWVRLTNQESTHFFKCSISLKNPFKCFIMPWYIHIIAVFLFAHIFGGIFPFDQNQSKIKTSIHLRSAACLLPCFPNI